MAEAGAAAAAAPSAAPAAAPLVARAVAAEPRCRVGEGAWWDADAKVVRFLDVESKKLYAFDPCTGGLEAWDTPQKPGSFAATTDPSTFLVAFEDGLYLYRPSDGQMTPLGPTGGSVPTDRGGRLNDGRCDRQGRFVCGGVNLPANGIGEWEALSRVWQVRHDKTVAPLLSDKLVKISNSICFAPDGRTMYFSDTMERTILAYDYDPATGEASRERVFADLERLGIPGLPDGSTVDAEGGVWNCQAFAGRVTRFLPDGTPDIVVQVDGSGYPTCPAIGGDSLDTLFVTSASGDDIIPMCGPDTTNHAAGSLFSVKVPVKGLEETKFPL